MDKLGYQFYIDQGIEYRAIYHDRLSKDWDEKYLIASQMYFKHHQEILNGKREKINYLKDKYE